MDDLSNFKLELGETSELGMAVSLALMMFSVALGLRREHFGFIKTAPQVFFTGVFAQLVALPVVTVVLCFIIQPPPAIALGMILIACCPGGNVSNILVLLANGNTALSVSLTATSSIAAAFLTPVSILFWSALYPPTSQLLTQIDFNAQSFLLQTAAILALPLLLGALCVKFQPRLAKAIRQPLVTLSALILVTIIVIAFIKYFDVLIRVGLVFVGVVALHNAIAFLLGNLLARIARADVPSRRALTYEVGIQNSGLGIVILLTQLSGLGGAAAVAGLWGTWHILAGGILVVIFRISDWYSLRTDHQN